MKRIAAIAAALLLIIPSLLLFAGCSNDERVLRVFNWEEYISEEDDPESGSIDIIAAFEEEYGVTVEYSTFGTNENMYNELQINPGGYDLVCPSDYMIMKMIDEDMVEPFSDEFLQNGTYSQHVSPYIADLFESNGWTQYAAAYMWGTMGYVYNPDLVDVEDLTSWAGIWNEKYRSKSTIKDSVRDSYFLGVAYVYRDELTALAQRHAGGELNDEEYNAQITSIMNRTDQETLDRVADALIELKSLLYGFEVDSGKQDMITGKITINFCWSGDGVYAMDEAEPFTDDDGVYHDGIYLNYVVPDECTNIWFDGWVMPKGADTELAEAFINFLSRPENAIANMNYIGYTSAIAGDEVFDEMVDWYGEGEEGDVDENGDPLVPYDINYFFEGTGEYDDYSIWVSEESLSRQVSAQYPTEEVILRSAVMANFDNETNALVNDMWEQVKSQPVPVGAYVTIAVIAAAVLVIVLTYLYRGKRSAVKPKKGYRRAD